MHHKPCTQCSCILLKSVTRAESAGQAVKLCRGFAQVIHTDSPERHPQPLPRGESAFQSALCHPNATHSLLERCLSPKHPDNARTVNSPPEHSASFQLGSCPLFSCLGIKHHKGPSSGHRSFAALHYFSHL